MINANELMIGNIVSFKGNFKAEICSVSKHTVQLKGQTGVCVIDFLEPVTITEKILDKLGYVQYDEENNRWIHPHFKDYHMEEKALYFGTTAIEIEYLHDLQNILFALTRKQVSYNLKS